MKKIEVIFLVFLFSFIFATESHTGKDLISHLSTKTEYVVEDVFKGLVDTAKAELDTLQAEWPGIQAEKQGAVDFYTCMLNDQSDKLEEFSTRKCDLEEKIADAQDEIATYSEQLIVNNDRVNVMLDDRRTQNRKHITDLKKNKETLDIIKILKDSIDSFNPALLEKKSLNNAPNDNSGLDVLNIKLVK